MSSTKAREDLMKDKTSDCVDPIVQSYCLSNSLYLSNKKS